jgi:hypothetical protein
LRHGPHRSGETARLRLAIELSEDDAGLYPCGARFGVHANDVHLRQIDQQSPVAGRMTGEAVPSAANRDQQLVVASEGERTAHVAGVRAASNQRWLAIESAVPHFARGVVLRVAGPQEWTCETCSQVFDVGRRQLTGADGHGDQRRERGQAE